MMSSASQGPGWWQASDGKWYPPEQKAGYAPPPPPSGFNPAGQAPPQSWPAPSASPQYPAAGGGQTLANAQAIFASAVATTPRALWLLYGGIGAALIALFLPWFSVGGGGLVFHFSLGDAAPGTRTVLFLSLAASFGLAWAIYAQPRTQPGTLIGLSVVIGGLLLHLIYNFLTLDADIAKSKSDLAGVDVSPDFGFILYTAALVFLAVRIGLLWVARSKPQPQAY